MRPDARVVNQTQYRRYVDINDMMFQGSDLRAVPVDNAEWWAKHVRYCRFNRQGIDIACALFEHPKPRGNVIFLSGRSHYFCKYILFI